MAYEKQVKEFQQHLRRNRKGKVVVPLPDYLKPSYFGKEYSVANGNTIYVNLLTDLDQAAKDVTVRSDQDITATINWEDINTNNAPDWQRYAIEVYQNQAVSVDGLLVRDLKIENNSGATATVRIYASRFYSKTKTVD